MTRLTLPVVRSSVSGVTMDASSVLVESTITDLSHNITNSSYKLSLGPNVVIVNDISNGSISSTLPINTSATVTAYNLNIGVDSSANANLTIDSCGNFTTQGRGIINNGLTVSDGSLNVTNGSIYSNTTYDNYFRDISSVVVNKNVLDQVVQNLTGGSNYTIESLAQLFELFSKEDVSVLNAILKSQTDANNRLLHKIDALYKYFFNTVSGSIIDSSLNQTGFVSSDLFVKPVVAISSNITVTDLSGNKTGPGTKYFIDASSTLFDLKDASNNNVDYKSATDMSYNETTADVSA
jgi:hypothetical protein